MVVYGEKIGRIYTALTLNDKAVKDLMEHDPEAEPFYDKKCQ